MLYKSPLTTLSYKFVFICICCPQLHTGTHTHNLARHSAGMDKLSEVKHAHTLTHTDIDMCTVTQARNKDINMTKCLCGSTQRSIHTLRDTLTHSKGSRGSSELTNPWVDESTGSLVDFVFTVILSICLFILTSCPYLLWSSSLLLFPLYWFSLGGLCVKLKFRVKLGRGGAHFFENSVC